MMRTLRRFRWAVAAVILLVPPPSIGSDPRLSRELAERIRREVSLACVVVSEAIQVPDVSRLARRIPADTRPVVRVAAEEPCGETVAVVLQWERGTAERAVVKATIRRARQVAVAIREISRGDEVRFDDFRVESRHLKKSMLRSAADPESVIGKRARRRIPRDAVLRSNWVEIVPVVERGQRVRLVFSRGDLEIESIGRAEEDAGEGETLRAINIDSKKRVVGRVERSGLVRVDF